jgi:hypothetical protein
MRGEGEAADKMAEGLLKEGVMERMAVILVAAMRSLPDQEGEEEEMIVLAVLEIGMAATELPASSSCASSTY